MKLHEKIGALSVMMLVASACPSDPEPTPDGGDADAGMTDVELDTTPEPDSSDAEADACVPLTECPVDTCGTVDDGCEGTLECGACDCVEGESAQTSCGPCGLGTLTCEDGATGGGTCVAPDFAGVDVEAACGNIVYVSVDGPINPDGSSESPYGTLSQALSNVTEPGMVVVANGDYEEPSTIRVVSGVHVVGGFTPETWAWTPEGVSRFNVAQEDEDGIVGLLAGNLLDPTVLAHWSLTTADASEDKGVTGVLVSGSPTLVLSHVDVKAGGGGKGSDGLAGANGAAGFGGGDAPDSTHSVLPTNPSGTAGTNASCPEADGGAGGRGAHAGTNSQIFGSEAGEDSVGQARGGQRGTSAFRAGGDGETLPKAGNGADGDSGRSSGTFIAGKWVLTFGDGEPGIAGTAGRGGGGGGGADWPDSDPTTQRIGNAPGASGGGGGAGGCGGGGGEGGKAGGVSFGLLVFGSTGLTLKESTFTAGSGGEGGRGGEGGAGGDAGLGGLGTPGHKATSGSTPVAYTVLGGEGGDGAPGSDGGRGGAGAGGSSYGAWCESSVLNFVGTSSFVASAPGLGGVAAEPGQNGIAKEDEGCR